MTLNTSPSAKLPRAVRQFSTEHLVVLALTAVAVAVAVVRPRLIPPRALAVWIGGAYLIEFTAHVTSGQWDWGFDLPFHLSDVLAIFAPVALWTRRPLLVEVLYFWALTASLQAVVTPDLRSTVPSVYFFTYFATHCGAVVGACLLVFGLGQRPRPGRGAAGVRRHARDGRGGGDGRPGHGRQLHVPAGQAGTGLPARRHGPMAGVHPQRGRGGARAVRAAEPRGYRSST